MDGVITVLAVEVLDGLDVGLEDEGVDGAADADGDQLADGRGGLVAVADDLDVGDEGAFLDDVADDDAAVGGGDDLGLDAGEPAGLGDGADVEIDLVEGVVLARLGADLVEDGAGVGVDEPLDFDLGDGAAFEGFGGADERGLRGGQAAGGSALAAGERQPEKSGAKEARHERDEALAGSGHGPSHERGTVRLRGLTEPQFWRGIRGDSLVGTGVVGNGLEGESCGT